MRRLGQIGLAGLACALLIGSSASASGSQQIEITPSSALLAAVNDARRANGVPPLRLSQDLTRAATAHSVAMLTSGTFAHESPDGTSFGTRVRQYYRASGFASWSAAENLLESSSMLAADRAVLLWLHSPPHRRNLLDPDLREAGIGAAFTTSAHGAFGRGAAWVVTLDLGRRLRG